MRRHLTKLGLISSALALVTLGGTMAFALPPQANAHAQTAGSGSGNAATGSSHAAVAQANAGTHLADAKLKACQNRETAINNIMTRINTRAQKQLTLFDTIATRVENFSTTKGTTVAGYDQLVASIASAKDQAQTDLSTLQGNSTFSCDGSNPKGMVTAFQGYLKTEITDLQNYRTAVKDLIVAVAKANNVTVSDSSQTGQPAQPDQTSPAGAQGGQQ